MIEEFRDRLSARLDGELPPAELAAVEAHLTGCAECSAYAGRLETLRALTAALPREPAPAGLPARVAARIRAVRRRRLAWRLAPVPVLATVIALVIAVPPGGPGLFPLPPAAAADGLLRLRTLYAEREIVDAGTVTREKVWFRAPGDVRIERLVTRPGQPAQEQLLVQRPGLEWDGGTVRRNLPPVIGLPEPVSPTVALLGEDQGPGPVVAGRPTRKYLLSVGERSRVALVDAQAAGVLGGADRIVLQKTEQGGLGLSGPVKRTLVVRYDEPLPDALFLVPGGPGEDGGFVSVPVERLAIRPRRVPEGFVVVRAARSGGAQAILYAQGALPILVTTVPDPADPELSREELVTVAGRPATLVLDLYAVPQVSFTVGNRRITVAAPLPRDSLIRLAAELYPR